MNKIKFLGASGTVTGSNYLLTPDNGKGILIDMGMFQGVQEIEDLNYLPLQFDARQVAAVVLTHAHLDHCGRLPLLVNAGFRGPIYMTEPTRVLAELTLLDAARVAADTHDHLPIYTEAEVFRIISQMEIVKYDEEFQLGRYKAIMRDAGHILGSASVEIFDSKSQHKRIVFSGDLGNSPEDIVRPTKLIESADIVIMESTYGDRTHSDENPDEVLREEINAVEDSGGTLLIPAFSLERVQEILHKIDHLKGSHQVQEATPVFLDSPMAIKATRVYKQYKNLYSTELSKHTKKDDPFDFPGLRLTDKAAQSREIHQLEGPKVIIAGSGMMTGGRILHHALHYLPNPSTRLLVVGFQAEETLGRQIIDGARQVTIDDQLITIKAHVRKSSAMSAHADQPKLLKWISHIKSVKHVCLTHGEDLPRQTLAGLIQSRAKISNVYQPLMNEEIEFA